MDKNLKIVSILGSAVVLAALLRLIAGPTAVMGTGAIYAAANVPGYVHFAAAEGPHGIYVK
jgi:hypothetical protein